MSRNGAYRRSTPRRRGVGRGEAQGDAVAAALTAQVIVCVLLLVVAVLVKKVDETRYDTVRQECGALMNNPAGIGGFAGLVQPGDGVRQAFAAMEQWISQLVERVVSRSAPPPPALEVPPDPAPFAGEEEGEQPADSSVIEQGGGNRGYDYLGAGGGALLAAMQTGQGGAYPVSISGGQDRSKLPAPAGATYAQVLLNTRLVPPVTGPITSEFSYRLHPVSGEDDFHTGMDIAAEEGRDILAALPGKVAEVGESEIYGKYIILQHATNLQTFYGHCSEILAGEGVAVRRGERIAKVGKTGVTTGPHLHFSVIVEEQFTDPYWVLSDNIRLVD